MLSEDFNIGTLRAVELFRPLSNDELELIRPALTVREIPIGDTMMEEGEPGDDVYVLLAGEVKVVTGHRTPEETVVSSLGPVEVLGEMSLLSGEPRSATIVATDTCQVLVLKKAGLDEVLLAHPSICMALLRDAHKRLVTLTHKLSAYSRN